MSLSNAEFAAILDDTTKTIIGDIVWAEDEDHSPSVEFRAEVQSQMGYPLFIRASYNPLVGAATFALILKTVGRFYALDLGKDHHNPSCQQVGELHKHQWSEQFRDKEAYVPNDITASVNDPVGAWQQFCEEAKIRHDGKLSAPPPLQQEIWP